MDIHQIMWITCSPWTEHLDRSSSHLNLRLVRNKAISDGAISFYLNRLAFPNSHMVPLSISHMTRLIQTTNIGLETRSPLFLGLGGSVDLSIFLPKVSCYSLSWRAWVCYLQLKTFISKIPKFRRRRISEVLLLGNSRNYNGRAQSRKHYTQR